jgi:hypothetical protein
MEPDTTKRDTLPERRLQAFLYLLIRDYLPTGDVELIFEMLEETKFDDEVLFTCPHVEALSGDLSRRLLGERSGMSDNEQGQHEDRKENPSEEDPSEEDSRQTEGSEEDSHPEGSEAVSSLEGSEAVDGADCAEFQRLKEELDEAYPEGSVFDVGDTIATGESYPHSNEDDARVREAAEDDRREGEQCRRVIGDEITEGDSDEFEVTVGETGSTEGSKGSKVKGATRIEEADTES